MSEQQYQEVGTSQEVDGGVKDLRSSGEGGKPGSIEGIYQGSQTFDSKRKGETSTIHYFKSGDKVLGCWGQTDLNKKLSAPELIGKSLKCSFKEKREMPDKRTKNIYVVLVAK